MTHIGKLDALQVEDAEAAAAAAGELTEYEKFLRVSFKCVSLIRSAFLISGVCGEIQIL